MSLIIKFINETKKRLGMRELITEEQFEKTKRLVLAAEVLFGERTWPLWLNFKKGSGEFQIGKKRVKICFEFPGDQLVVLVKIFFNVIHYKNWYEVWFDGNEKIVIHSENSYKNRGCFCGTSFADRKSV